VLDSNPFYPRFTALERIELDIFIGGGDHEGEWVATSYLSSLLNHLPRLKDNDFLLEVFLIITRRMISKPHLTKVNLGTVT
jgi:hypothetical protein